MPHPMLFILALVDILSGILLFFHPGFWLKLILYLAIISLMKGGWSLMTAFASRFYLDFLGFLDIIAGISLLFLYHESILPFFTILGIAMVMKGLWSMFFSITCD